MLDGESPRDAAARLLGERVIAPESIDKYDKNRIGFMVSMVRTIAPTLVEHDLIARASVMGITDAGALAKLQRVEFLDPPEEPMGISVTVAHRFATIRVSESAPDRAAAVDLAREIASALVRGAQLRAFDPASGQEVRIAAKGEGLSVPLAETASSTTAQSISLSGDSPDSSASPWSGTSLQQSVPSAQGFIVKGRSVSQEKFDSQRVRDRARLTPILWSVMLLPVLAGGLMAGGFLGGEYRWLWQLGLWVLTAFAVVAFVAIGLSIRESWRVRDWRRRRCCPNCGYSRRGLREASNCPECGAPSPDVG